ncbi:EAL domain-containing protein [Metabacillus sp. B2-18]|uniref:EAL domain-containing protein n=1 Tax=Metabacillus sp. B2-18 TaxID=2897333 RepID=UPI001E5E64F7|nr:EAL domain-containing protein [Metabacillus sp. B2-18]UGB30124.1 EAL domain-containing protein [Metabacillus sp. B2-18]
MISGLCEKHYRRLRKWSKLFLHKSKLKFYPPKFVLRDPILEGVHQAMLSGHQVAVVVMTISNLREFSQQLEPVQLEEYKTDLRTGFKSIVEDSPYNSDLLVVHDYYSEGLTIFFKINDDKQSVVYIENLIRTLVPRLERWMFTKYPYFNQSFEIGYMFIEREHSTIQDALYTAQQQAVAMAEKRIQSRYIETLLEMRDIIQKQDVSLLAQPIIDLSTNQIKAWEFLTRGPKDTAFESPLQLFSLARQSNLIYDLELLVLEKAFHLINSVGCMDDVFLNFTPITLGNKRFIPGLEKLLTRYPDIEPRRMIFEVTERDSIEGLKFFHDNIKQLRQKGFRIAVDDTGAGYSSLYTISELLPDIIKIDRSVIQDIDTSKVKESMLKGLILIARETGSLVVAEGIEKKEEAEVLKRNQVDLAQGYFYAKPGQLQKERVALV